MNTRHYIAMSGFHGCSPDSCTVWKARENAVESITSQFNLGRSRNAMLKRDSYIALSPRDGADYASVESCDCLTPWIHDDSMTEELWKM